jgi:hypothetical protein
MRIMLSALIIAAALTTTLATMEHSAWWPGWDSTPGIWGAVLNLPGFVIAAGMHYFPDDRRNDYLMHFIMFLVNWLFYWGVVQGFVTVRRKVFK